MKSSDVLKFVTTFVLGAVIGGLAVASVAVSRVEVVPTDAPTEISVVPGGAVKYNCELSGGTFQNEACVCPIEEQLGQTQEMMYDESKGYCQTTFGGPGGEAFAASMGLPRGHYAFWTRIIFDLCQDSGGSISGAACICPDGSSYDPEQGECVNQADLDCTYRRYGLRAGETYDDGCNRHTCQADGSVVSTEVACE